MRAAVLHHPALLSSHPLQIEELPIPMPRAGEVLLRVEACGVCRTDLHIVAGELKPLLSPVTPGHQIVGRIVAAGDSASAFPTGRRVGISWLGGTDGTCALCLKGLENLCDNPTFTGYTVNGGYAQDVIA